MSARASSLLLLGVGLLVGSDVAAAVFSDGTFANGDWTATVTTQTGGASQTVIGQVASGGSPGAWREATHSFVGAGVVRVYHERQGMSFDPSTLGADEVLVLDYSEDRIEISPPFGGAAVGAAPALRQDGIVYAGPDINYTNTSWATVVLTGLSAGDFTPYGGTGHPDFTSTGSPITFGYYRTNSNTGGSSFTITHGIDDWSFTTSTASIGEAIRESKISDTAGGFTGTLVTDDRFGEGVAGIGDIDGDGVGDLAVYEREDTPGTDAGAIWVLRLKADGSVKTSVKVGEGAGGFLGTLVAGDRFGVGLEGLGDLNYDGIPDLAAGAPGDDTFGPNRGAVWVLFLNANGTIRSEQRIADGLYGLPRDFLADGAAFGRSVARLGDLDGDGVTEIAVGASTAQAIYVLFLDPDGYVRDIAEISQVTVPSLGLVPGEGFGGSAASPGDIDGDGIPDLAVGALLTDEGPTTDVGAVYVFLLNADGTAKSFEKLTSASVTGGLSGGDRFGVSLEEVGDLDGDGVPDLAVGTDWDDTVATNAGSIHVLFLNADGSAKSSLEITEGVGGFGGNLDASDEFGSSLARVQGGSGALRLAVGAQSDDDGGTNHGAVWLLSLAGEVETPLCGNGWVERNEECDDGNTVSADTCSAACQTEDIVMLAGIASGGTFQITVSGAAWAFSTGGDTAAEVLAGVASTLSSDATLQAQGIYAIARGDVLYTNGSITSRSESDPGLFLDSRDDLTLSGSTVSYQLDFNLPVPPLALVVAQPVDLPAGLVRAEANFQQFTIPVNWHQFSTETSMTRYGFTWYDNAFVFITGVGCLGGFPLGAVSNPPASVSFANVRGYVAGAGDLWCGVQVPPSSARVYTPLYLIRGPLSAVGAGITQAATSLSGFRNHGLPFTDGTASVVTNTLQQRRGIPARRPDLVGVINTVTPIAIDTNPAAYAWGGMSQLRLRFVPEPMVGWGGLAGTLLLLLVRRLGRRRQVR